MLPPVRKDGSFDKNRLHLMQENSMLPFLVPQINNIPNLPLTVWVYICVLYIASFCYARAEQRSEAEQSGHQTNSALKGLDTLIQAFHIVIGHTAEKSIKGNQSSDCALVL